MLTELLTPYIGVSTPIHVETSQLSVDVFVKTIKDKPSACFTGYYIDDEETQRHLIFSVDPQSMLQNQVLKISVEDQVLYIKPE